VKCNRCGAPLHDHNQMRFAAVCSCGQLQDIYVPKHCGTGMSFRESGVRLTDSYWRCTNSGCSYTERFNAGGKCFNQSCDRNDLTVLPHSASTTFYPQTHSTRTASIRHRSSATICWTKANSATPTLMR
jgi:hypothetical protein